ncbi:GCD6 [Candida oxycetoniae]|uniref:Translation initiation factor eIF2B subunit epsilon n=1 Tax=Candida oxycetoniae TaxID=497107 RepID=A0AAI9X065_9ASCO|nr:GCD6 [Candida oxycetoniae]KAI3406789.2 GCD6 [Candida oxycetoniae]
MAPKNKGVIKKKDVRDDRFQAVVLTDSFETRFMPLTVTTPRCLLPLVNIPLIEYTLEFLVNADINEVFLVCTSHSEKIQEYIEKSKWSNPNSSTQITLITSLESRSIGDVMRDIDNRGLITNDFLLVSGDLVSNIDFKKVLDFHKSKTQQDKNHMVTMILNKASPLHRMRSRIEPATFVLDKKTSKCVYYQSIPPVDGKKSSVNIGPELLEEDDDFVLRNDLVDCHLDICTPHVPQIFQENFDYQYLRSDFLKGVLTSDLLRKTVYAYISEEGSDYSARVESWGTYNAVSQDILGRWCYPLSPDCNLAQGTSYSYEFNNIYKEEKVLLAHSCKIGSSTAIGRNSRIGEGSSVGKSVIGRNCVIGKNVLINNSYIWDDVVVEDKCVLNNCIVASHAVLKEGVRLLPNCVIGSNVVIGKNITIPSGSRLIEKKEKEKERKDDDNGDGNTSSDFDLVGEDGEGVLYQTDNDESDEEESSIREPSMLYQMHTMNISDDSIASISNKRAKRRSHTRSRRFSSNSFMSEGQDEFEEELFDVEGLATVSRAIENNHDIDTALLELNTLRMSMNVTYHEVRSVTGEAILKKILEFITTDTLKPQEAAVKLFSHWGKMFKRQVFSSQEEVDLLNTLEGQIANLNKAYNQVILFVALKTLYDIDIVEEDNILKWWHQDKKDKEVRGLSSKFINWLEEAEEDEESGDEDGDGDENEDDEDNDDDDDDDDNDDDDDDEDHANDKE